jgi:hypothetical protein
MNRFDVIQKLLDACSNSTYLEIGVRDGTIFLPVRAKAKIAVDPYFIIPWKQKFKYPYNFVRASYFCMPSDVFFEKHNNLFKHKPIDVAFIDGMHTYEQSLRDVENCLQYLSPQGSIVMHDCNPPSAAAMLPTMEEAKRVPGNTAWCGDVWKTIAFIRSTRADLQACVLDCDYGLGIIFRGSAEKLLSFSPDTIRNLSYNEFAAQRDELLNLKSPEYINEICSILNSRQGD